MKNVVAIMLGLVLATFATTAQAQCSCKKATAGRPAASPSPSITRSAPQVSPFAAMAMQQQAYNAGLRQQVLAQQLYTQRQKMMRELKKQQGAAKAAARKAEDESQSEPSPKPQKPKTGKAGLLERAAELGQK